MTPFGIHGETISMKHAKSYSLTNENHSRKKKWKMIP